jgi:hypothetical protein
VSAVADDSGRASALLYLLLYGLDVQVCRQHGKRYLIRGSLRAGLINLPVPLDRSRRRGHGDSE